ncbi:MAG: Sec-independent protein translocase protein TatB [Alphaproteobacteria bacterium]|nr:Sec-independent protein translocase protein TatB [Alphaproteobacteria bacterium]
MFGIDSSELAVIALVALLVIGPRDLPRALRWVGQYVGKARAMSRHLRTGFDAMMREAELDEMQKIWAAQNEAIMKASALPDGAMPDLAGPVPAAEPAFDPATDPWADPPALTAPPPAPPAAEPAAPAPRARKPRAKKAAASAASGGDAA